MKVGQNSKKIGTITFHNVHNYGAVLQAYALPKALGNLGYFGEIINFCMPGIYDWYHVEQLQEVINRHGLPIGVARYCLRKLRGDHDPKQRRNKFEHFIYHDLPISAKAYRSAAEMKDMDYDAILFGSDQIWNAKLTGGVALEFVGGFHCQDKTKRIAYAASCGRSEFSQEEKDNYYPFLKQFNALGIREQGFCQSLRVDGFAAQQVLDPTLLLTKAEWGDLINKSSKHEIEIPKKPYLLVYVFDEDPSVYRLVDQMAQEYGLEVCVIAYEKKAETAKYCVHDNCGPKDFVRLFANASKVVTTSFHGTVFSILFEKDFICVPHPTLHERTDSLLSLLGLEARNYKSDTNILERLPIDWDRVGQRLQQYRNDSLRFIKEAIE